MDTIKLNTLGINLQQKRGDKGIREVAKEIGTSPTTLSRVENGHIPDLQTFTKICTWMEVDPGEVLGTKLSDSATSQASVHFRKPQTLDSSVANSLANMIVAAQRAMSTDTPGRDS